MSTVATFPDAEMVIAEYLRNASSCSDVNTKIPNPRPSPLVLVRRVGGPRLNVVADDALLAIECWDADEADAQALAQECRTLLHLMRGTTTDGAVIYRVAEAGGPQNLPDPLSDEPRYTFTVSVAMRGSSGVPVVPNDYYGGGY